MSQGSAEGCCLSFTETGVGCSLGLAEECYSELAEESCLDCHKCVAEGCQKGIVYEWQKNVWQKGACRVDTRIV